MKKKIGICMMLWIIIIRTCLPITYATQRIEKANLKPDHTIETHLKYDKNGTWTAMKAAFICFEEGGKKYPAYCISHGIHGVDEEGPYTVTIEELLTDDSYEKGNLIYNTILNGYPYKTAQQLGVENNDDAYLATKQAIYSVLLERDVKTFYKGIDAKGEKIVEAIYEISEKGKQGSQINQEAMIRIQKVGKLTEENGYYYQEYVVESNVAFNTYQVTIQDFTEEASVRDTQGIPKYAFLKGENFRIQIPKTSLTENIQGNIFVSALCNTKPVFVGRAPNNQVQNYAITYAPEITYETTNTTTIHANTASIQILKKDRETLKPISNVSFQLYQEDGTLLYTEITNQKGIATFANLYPGKYFLKEMNTDENYIVEDTTYTMRAELNQQTTKTITNQHKKGNLKIQKVDKDDNSITLGAIEFDLLDEEKNVVTHLVTDVNGEAQIQNLNVGKYILQETKTKNEYDLCTNKDIIIQWEETTELMIENEKKKGQIQVTKEDKDNSNIKLQGVVFQILNTHNQVVESITTNQQGEAISSLLPIGDYTIQEISLGENKHYILQETTYPVKVENHKITEIHLQNEHKKGNLKILKVDKDNHRLPLQGIEFDLINEQNESIAHLITDVNGEAYIENINIGDYVLRETKTQNEYNLCENHNIVIIENETSEIMIENEKKKGQIEVYKIDGENKEIKIPNVKFQLLDSNYQEVDCFVTDDKGYAISKKLPLGKYFLKEIETDNKYVLQDEPVQVFLEEEKIKTFTFENELKKGKIQITKISSKDSPVFRIQQGDAIQNVTFFIYNEKGILVDMLTTNETGQAISKSLPIGRYKVIEKQTAPYFLMNKNEFLVNIEDHGTISKIEITNEPMRPEVKIKKIGQVLAERNEEIPYSFIIQNKSNTELDKFTWNEYLPYEKLKVTKIITGTYNEDLDYKIFYKTNQEDYRLFQTANTLHSEYLDFTKLALHEKEKITEIKIEYPSVSKDFMNIDTPIIYGKIDSNVKKGEKITNRTELTGWIGEYTVKDKSMFETVIIEKEIQKKLPKTGC